MSRWIDVGRVDEIPVQGSRIVRTELGDIAVFRTVDGSLFALRDRCPHKGGPLSQGIVHGSRVTCPLHNWVIDLESGHAAPPDVGCARTYSLRAEAGRLYLGVPDAGADRTVGD
jgi:nitrite reductase (NADH) small subunit